MNVVLQVRLFEHLKRKKNPIPTSTSGCDNMKEIDLMSIGSYTELPGGNISLPQGYSSVLSPIIHNIPPENILKQHPIKSINWLYRWGQELGATGGGSEEDGGDTSDDGSDCSVRTVKSIGDDHEISEEQIKGLCQVSLPASVVSSRRGSKDLDDPAYRKSGKPSVKLECENGTVFYADQVICTIPLGIINHYSHSGS